ncbi:hypothetical protein G7D34_003699 [Salmonella enterica]|nr:hypothetical protein [Salmonella enterica]
MEYIKAARKAGEPTISAPLELCQITRERLSNWQRLPVEMMQEEITNDIESLDRFEFIAHDNGKIKAMLIATVEENPHYGTFLLTRYAFSAEPNTLTAGYRWLFKLAKVLNYDGVLYTRQLSGNKILQVFKSND